MHYQCALVCICVAVVRKNLFTWAAGHCLLIFKRKNAQWNNLHSFNLVSLYLLLFIECFRASTSFSEWPESCMQNKNEQYGYAKSLFIIFAKLFIHSHAHMCARQQNTHPVKKKSPPSSSVHMSKQIRCALLQWNTVVPFTLHWEKHR